MLQTLHEVKEILGYRDLRSACRWCKKKNVEIIQDDASRKKYVIKAEFEKAFFETGIRYLKDKYSSIAFPDVFRSYMNLNSELIFTMEEKNNVNKSKYQPAGEHEKTFLTSLMARTTEL